MKHLVIIDGYGFVFRAFHSLPPLTRKDGLVVGAVFGFTSMMMKLLTETQSSHIAIVFDSGGKNFRHNLYPEYKANRPKPPEELVHQFPLIRQAATAFNVTTLEKEGYEADDIIATLAKEAERNNFKVTIVSSDKDLMQLVNNNIVMYDPIKSKIIDNQKVKEKFNVDPSQVRDVLALVGDSSDNIPGVKGIGLKGASDLILEFNSFENLINNLDKVSQNRYRNAFIKDIENAKLSYQLVALDYKVPLDITLDDLLVKQVHFDDLQYFLEKNEFKHLQGKANYLFKNGGSQHTKTTINGDHFKTNEAFEKIDEHSFISKISDEQFLVIHVYQNDYLLLGSFKKYYTLVPINNISEPIKKILIEDSILKLGFGIKNLLKLVEIRTFEDIQLMGYLLDSSVNVDSILNLANHYLGIDQPELTPAEILKYYDEIYPRFRLELKNKQNLSLYETIEKPLIPILNRMENNGIILDSEKLSKLKILFNQQLKEIEEEIFRLAGTSFNIASPKQLGEVLFDKLQLPSGKKGKSGLYSTDIDVLENLSIQGFEIADKIINYRMLAKLISTYTDPLINLKSKDDNRIHTTFSMVTTITGRLSSSNPNLQNIPTRTKEGQRIREAFIAPRGYKLVSLDYSQIELRILAHIADITELKEAFKHNLDIHKITASQIFGIPQNEINDELRRKAKAINFGIIYGISAFGLAKQIMVSRSEAKEIINLYLEKYKGIKAFMENSQAEAKTLGFVKTLLGRRCYIKDISSSNPTIRGFAERLAINAPIQGSAADIIKLAMLEVQKLTSDNVRMVLQIHDELIFEIKEDLIEEITPKLKKTMESVINLSVPLTVNYTIGDNWGQL